MVRLGVLGWPVAHSRSPEMHNAALSALGLTDWTYQRLPVPPHLFEQTTRALSGTGFRGANVTIPHKQAALALADSASETASAIGAANTLTFTAEGAISADNTDAPGLLAALPCSPAGLSALVLGAGGSSRAAVWALRHAGAASIAIANRTHERAEALAREFDADAVRRPIRADLLVNCTAVGLVRSATEEQTLNQLGMTNDAVGRYSYVVDFVYRDAAGTPLLQIARRHGVQTVDGLEILVAQGALSLEAWTGRQVPREAMLAAARGQ
ncbi:MAG TPA: shikimate dehydrogenase [Solirubrobacteraceae bacterium]|jgi:shikimate dehydrogenase